MPKERKVFALETFLIRKKEKKKGS